MTIDHKAPKGEGLWRDMDSAPYSRLVEVRVGRRLFPARLLPNHSVNENEESCDQWVAEIDGNHPKCWSDGACWESNADCMMSAQPTHWRPTRTPQTEQSS